MYNSPKIFTDLHNKKIRYFVWKNTNIIEKFFNGEENLDIFIHNNDHKKFKQIIKKNNWIEVKSTSNNFNEIKHYLFFEKTKILHIHAYFKLFTGNSITKNYDLTNFTNYFKNIHFDHKYKLWILNYDLQLKLFEIRFFLKKDSLLGKYLLYRDGNSYEKELKNIISKLNNSDFVNTDFNNKLFYFKNTKKNKILMKSIKNFQRINSFKSLCNELLFIIKIFFVKIFKLNKFKVEKKVIIFISGADSSGKTTITHLLESLLKKFFKTKIFSIGKPYPEFLIKFLVKKKYFSKKKKLFSNYSLDKSYSYFMLLKNINLAIFRYFYSLNIFYLNPTINIIILDRYISKNKGDINGPKLYNACKKSFLKKKFEDIESFFYKITNSIDHEYRIITSLKTCLIRNKHRYKEVKKTDDEIIKRYKIFCKSNFKSKNVHLINNNLSLEITVNKLLYIFSKNLNENN